MGETNIKSGSLHSYQKVSKKTLKLITGRSGKIDEVLRGVVMYETLIFVQI